MTLIELLLVVSIISIIGYSIAATGANFLTRNYLQNTEMDIVTALRTAQLNALSGKRDSKWGVDVKQGGVITVFAGNSYALRNTVYDVIYKIPPSLSVNNTEVVYEKVSGNVTNPVVIIITDPSGTEKQISVNIFGIVDEN